MGAPISGLADQQCGTPISKRYARVSSAWSPRGSEMGKDFGTPPVMFTPDRKKRGTDTPPTRPRQGRMRLQHDIDVALQVQSLPLLSMALLNGHSSNNCIYEAVRHQHPQALEFLLQHGRKSIDSHWCGLRPLHVALQCCHIKDDIGHKLAEILLKHGAKPDYVGDDMSGGDAPTQNATKRGCIAALSLLLEYNADPNVVDINGHTPLHLLCKQISPLFGSALELAQVLLRHGACPLKRDVFNLQAAHYTDDATLKQMLVRAGRQWTRCTLALARGQPKVDMADPRNESTAFLFVPEIFDMIASFV